MLLQNSSKYNQCTREWKAVTTCGGETVRRAIKLTDCMIIDTTESVSRLHIQEQTWSSSCVFWEGFDWLGENETYADVQRLRLLTSESATHTYL